MIRRSEVKNGRLLVVDNDSGRTFTHLAQIALDAGVKPTFLKTAIAIPEKADKNTIILLNEPELRDVEIARGIAPLSIIICCSARSDQAFAICCFRGGADDFILRSEGDAALLDRLAEVLDQQCGDEHAPVTDEVERKSRLLGDSRELANIRRYIGKIAHSDVTALITGPTGSGKEVVALEMHEKSSRASGPLIALNCAAIPDNLIEGELFGYKKGAYTGASQSYPGKLKLADGGTLFLDEIGELSLAGQAKLLRAIETREAYRLGGQRPTHFDIRIVAATNRDLFAEAQAGRFREDLYYRIAVAQIALSPLSKRADDIMPIAEHFMRQMASKSGAQPVAFNASAIAAMCRYDWPGNARELRNCVELLMLSADSSVIKDTDLPAHIRNSAAPNQVGKKAEDQPDERALLFSVLADCDGNKTMAAKKLNWSRMTLYRKLERYGGSESVAHEMPTV